MTKEECKKLIDKKYKESFKDEKLYDDFAYFEGFRRGLNVAKEILGMLDKPNNKTKQQ